MLQAISRVVGRRFMLACLGLTLFVILPSVGFQSSASITTASGVNQSSAGTHLSITSQNTLVPVEGGTATVVVSRDSGFSYSFMERPDGFAYPTSSTVYWENYTGQTDTSRFTAGPNYQVVNFMGGIIRLPNDKRGGTLRIFVTNQITGSHFNVFIPMWQDGQAPRRFNIRTKSACMCVRG